jgi:hypothetical protein
MNQKRENYLKKYRLVHKQEISDYSKIWYIKNRDKVLVYKKQYRELNRKILSEKAQEYNKKKLAKNSSFRILYHLRRRILKVLKENSKSKSTLELIGCSVDKLKLYLESKFQPGMSWQNYGLYGWHIDHIKPCCQFDLSKPEEQRKCFNYKNLQPLWAKDNLSKGKKLAS